ncbi:glycerophosphodiester phosphodiesterase family protein [Cutibacterium equinum]|uniref:Glycerophosphodiester phosphodiesterase family protein n=1 Tax=Cutibacterium equinum TaxID=3016342 RepID=A0ABY7R102_9ACTN|nr:glycerophosphodiester phosphodiesterase family protein [Cutibacterium equinum]WCC80911.1 glycerophosphodiester phosphodiesterase family protein [Cutibacterium equinum]
MIGHARYAETNSQLIDLLEADHPAILVHRGSGRASIVENTCKGIKAAITEGADIVEIDIVASTDGDYYLFHDGYEPMAFGIKDNLTTLSTAELEKLNYSWALMEPGSYPLERLDTVLEKFPSTIFNIDRSWRWWPDLLSYMAERSSVGHLTVKCHASDETALQALGGHDAKFPFIPIVTSPEQVDRIAADVTLNTVAFELLAPDLNHPFADPSYLDSLRERGFGLMLNAINLADAVPLYAGFDDETSVLDDPDKGWGELRRRGADIIQTDWPSLLKNYLDS